MNLLKRMTAMRSINEANSGVEELARSSKYPLLREPLAHPQQHAKAFVFTLVDGISGTDFGFDRDEFMPDDVIQSYTHLTSNQQSNEAIGWSKPTEDFTIRASVKVADRLRGSEVEDGDHITTYPIGTRLGDIVVTEPTVGCPGSQMAYQLWDRSIEIATAENLWQS